jgi:hypothetical protein
MKILVRITTSNTAKLAPTPYSGTQAVEAAWSDTIDWQASAREAQSALVVQAESRQYPI